MNKWSRKYDKCQCPKHLDSLNDEKNKHLAKGLCYNCYHRQQMNNRATDVEMEKSSAWESYKYFLERSSYLPISRWTKRRGIDLLHKFIKREGFAQEDMRLYIQGCTSPTHWAVWLAVKRNKVFILTPQHLHSALFYSHYVSQKAREARYSQDKDTSKWLIGLLKKRPRAKDFREIDKAGRKASNLRAIQRHIKKYGVIAETFLVVRIQNNCIRITNEIRTFKRTPFKAKDSIPGRVYEMPRDEIFNYPRFHW